MPQPLNPSSPSLLLGSPQWDELDLLATELDLELIAGFQAQLGGVGLANEQVAVELDLGRVAEAATRLPLAATAAGVTKADALGFQECFIESGEVQALGAILLGADIIGGANLTDFWRHQQSISFVAVLTWIRLQQRLGQVDQEIRPHLDSGADLIFLRDLIDRAHEANGYRRVLEQVWQLQKNPGA